LLDRPELDVTVEMRSGSLQEVQRSSSQKGEGGDIRVLDDDEEDVPRQSRKGEDLEGGMSERA